VLSNAKIPICGFVAFSGTGKTTLLEKIIPQLGQQGVRIGVIKHAHHQFDIDKEGKDSYRLRQAGAKETLVASSNRWALVHEHFHNQSDPDLDQLLLHLSQDELDLILVEGFKHVPFPRIELHRPSLGKPLLFPEDDTIIAVASDDTIAIETPLPILDLNNPEIIAEFVCNQFLKLKESP